LTLIGLPPISGFIIKFFLIMILIKRHILLCIIIIITTLITLFFYTRIIFIKIIIIQKKYLYKNEDMSKGIIFISILIIFGPSFLLLNFKLYKPKPSKL